MGITYAVSVGSTLNEILVVIVKKLGFGCLASYVSEDNEGTEARGCSFTRYKARLHKFNVAFGAFPGNRCYVLILF